MHMLPHSWTTPWRIYVFTCTARKQNRTIGRRLCFVRHYLVSLGQRTYASKTACC